MSLSKNEFMERLAMIITEYERVMKSGKGSPDHIIVDGRRMIGVIEAFAGLVAEMFVQMNWAETEELASPYQ